MKKDREKRSFFFFCKQQFVFPKRRDYRRAMAELTSFSFTAKKFHDDVADSLAMLAGYLSKRPKIITVAKLPF